MQRLNIFTCANKPYEDFAPLFAISCLLSNPEATVEIGLEDLDGFLHRHGSAMQIVLDAAGEGRIILRSVPFRTADGRNIRPNSVRFVTEPAIRSEYVYISDIDIITLDPYLFWKHRRHMLSTGLPFSNRIRRDTDKLTGLHFTRYDALYPLPDCSDLDLQAMNDEVLLKQIVERRIGQFSISGNPYRPVHGIHISPNRPEAVTDELPGWGMENHVAEWQQLSHSPLFQRMRPFLSDRIKSSLETIEGAASADDLVLKLGRNNARMMKGYATVLRQRTPDFEPRIVVDVGAGESSLMLRSLMPSSTLYALEPAPARSAALARALGSDPAARVLQVALTGGRSSRRIAGCRLAWLDALLGDRAVTGDMFCEQNDIGAIDFLNIDTGGFDLVALWGFERLLCERRIDILQVTACTNLMDPLHFTLDAFASYLAPFGYGVLAVFEGTHDRHRNEILLLKVLFRANSAYD